MTNENYENDVFDGYGVEIRLKDSTSFLKIAETLTRAGVLQSKTLYQSCYIIYRRGRYAILHFKEMFGLIGKECNLTDEDEQRRDFIVSSLEGWDILDVVDDITRIKECPRTTFLKYKDKDEYILQPKFNLNQLKNKE